MFENKQINDLFRTSLNGFFDTPLDDIFNYKKVAPITYKRKDWKKYHYMTIGLGTINITNISDWEVSGDSGWEKVNDYFQNKDISDNQSATISKTFKQVKHIEFDYKVSSEQNYDFLDVYINGSRVIYISGEVDWQHYSQDFDNFTDIELKFKYYKDVSESGGNDSGYFKNLKLTSIAEIIATDYNINSLNGLNNKTKITTDYKKNKNDIKFGIIPYDNQNNLIKFRITPYNNNTNNSQFRITPYKNKQNLTFYRLGLENPPPIRIILKDLDDED